MEVACIDTPILIWGVQGNATAGQDDMVNRTKSLLLKLDKERTRVIVPAIVMGEFLLKIPVGEHPKYQELVSKRFMIVPYDLRAALVFSKIWHQKTQASVIEEIKAGGVSRTQLRADTMIVATAVASGASCIYGHDNHVKKLADGFITFSNVADLVLQTTYLE